MDYEQLSTPELQQECKNRGLPSGRSKAELVQRLTDDDAAGGETAPSDPETETAPEPGDEQPDAAGQQPGPEAQAVTPDPDSAPAPTVIRCTFPAGREGPGEEEHLAYRQTTIQTAVDQGLTPRGDAYRVGTVDRHEVYEVAVWPVT